MACSKDDTTCSTCHSHCDLNSRGGAQAQVDHLESHSLQGRSYQVFDHFAGNTAVSTDYNLFVSCTFLLHQYAESRRILDYIDRS
ncbi:hypothetical protein D9M68_683580 [compost metagenome]